MRSNRDWELVCDVTVLYVIYITSLFCVHVFVIIPNPGYVSYTGIYGVR